MKINLDLSSIIKNDVFETIQQIIGKPYCKIKRQTASTTPQIVNNPFNPQQQIDTEITVRCVYSNDKIAVIESDKELGAAYQKVFYILISDLNGYQIDNTHIIEFRNYNYKIKSINNLVDIVLEIVVE